MHRAQKIKSKTKRRKKKKEIRRMKGWNMHYIRMKQEGITDGIHAQFNVPSENMPRRHLDRVDGRKTRGEAYPSKSPENEYVSIVPTVLCGSGNTAAAARICMRAGLQGMERRKIKKKTHITERRQRQFRHSLTGPYECASIWCHMNDLLASVVAAAAYEDDVCIYSRC